jgi:SAM-dependent methyltransferase
MSKAPDPVEFRGTQRQHWDSAASGWRKWSELIDGAASGISERLVELAGVESGSRVLDVAAGYGEPSLTAARAAGPEGSVTATDISAEMIAFGRERATAAGLDNLEFVESDAASLEFPESSFDAALSRWGIIFEPDGEAAAARVLGFLESGARMAISSWGPPDRVPFLGIPMRTAMERLDVPPPPPGTPGPLSRPTPEALGGLLEAGGFSGVEVEEATVTFEWQSPRSSRPSSGRLPRRSPRSLTHTHQRCRTRPGRRSPRPPVRRPQTMAPSSSRTWCCWPPDVPS